MDWKILFSTFAIIFLAELGDKTQLTVLAKSASSSSTFPVLVGAVCALVLSTIIAVVIGSLLKRALPLHYIKAAAALLFIVFGVSLAWSACHEFRQPAKAPPEKVSAAPGVLGRFVMKEAAVFEQKVLENIRTLLDTTTESSIRKALEELVAQEQAHMEHLKSLGPHEGRPIHEKLDLRIEPGQLTKAKGLPATILEQEKAIEAFYSAVAEATHIPSVKKTFKALAAEERDHIRKWEQLIGNS